ncbi:bifunctional 3-(3-hydroxy-phenyl)propionate/3-hydroxycinnamic acid hydroxylase [Actinoplanes sp. DH11]|uniref:bifunctional 3-(3-hydroxy-phenyl)propionate/3-hydroxycinnamic acid hydroxylase MhpA n=1 Tax=Actinoplanes sp. DH11 TaxID=2857011 RepID=UPI001E285125|nr:bifunctional 3-(3-hydroxy-phenyl)propionate/3-hydroxycinnamic acid hydroxylase [Actinoplanes sp. DH11]
MQTNADVVIVGYGPVGQVLSILLAQRGHSVTVLERYPEPYPMPRAVAYDGEGARILAACGVAAGLVPVTELTRDYVWRNAAGDVLMRMEPPAHGRHGWPESTSMYQPGLEAVLGARGAELPTLRVLRGYQAETLAERDDQVVVRARSATATEDFTAAWVIGCDGANSVVREHVGTSMADYRFSTDWLICDVRLHEEQEFSPNNLQICDPARPRTAVSAGPGHRRWEFLRVPGETRDEMDDEDFVWRMLALFDLTPDRATLDRHAVYTTQAACANRWRSGRMLLAGDAAHVMPPFIGQGMCSGIRDAAALAWRLDLVLAGMAGETVLDSYTIERRAHVRPAIEASITLGKVLCETDPVKAAGRDTFIMDSRRRGTPVQAPQQGLSDTIRNGFLRRNADGVIVAPAGHLTPQGRVQREGTTGLFDQVVGSGFTLITTAAAELRPDDRVFLDDIGGHPVCVRPAGTPPGDLGSDEVIDLDGVYLPYLSDADAVAILVRPDFYLFGAAHGPDDVPALIADLRAQLLAPAGVR